MDENVDPTSGGNPYLDYDLGSKMVGTAVGDLATGAVLIPEPGALSFLAVGTLRILVFRRKTARP